ncbi:MAG: PCYCGC domain-containing protein, partial [Acidobacteriota bacterium]|nr:PCYCGC domain-containing protein [Acidobacteriota bacterium]
WDPSWPPLPASGTPARPIELARAAYAYAARRGDVLQYMPCYCGCERQGHRSNRDCFVKGVTAEGKPRWDEMGFT